MLSYLFVKKFGLISPLITSITTLKTSLCDKNWVNALAVPAFFLYPHIEPIEHMFNSAQQINYANTKRTVPPTKTMLKHIVYAVDIEK